MSCCTEYLSICNISSCDEWIKTTIAIPEGLASDDPPPFDVVAKFNGVQLTPQISFQDDLLAIKNTFIPNYTYEVRVTSHDAEPITTCYRFSITQNINL